MFPQGPWTGGDSQWHCRSWCLSSQAVGDKEGAPPGCVRSVSFSCSAAGAQSDPERRGQPDGLRQNLSFGKHESVCVLGEERGRDSIRIGSEIIAEHSSCPCLPQTPGPSSSCLSQGSPCPACVRVTRCCVVAASVLSQPQGHHVTLWQGGHALRFVVNSWRIPPEVQELL